MLTPTIDVELSCLSTNAISLDVGLCFEDVIKAASYGASGAIGTGDEGLRAPWDRRPIPNRICPALLGLRYGRWGCVRSNGLGPIAGGCIACNLNSVRAF